MKPRYTPEFDFDDILLFPQRSEAISRENVVLEREFTFHNSKRKWKGIPIIASNMYTVGNLNMYKALSKFKIITCLHKFHKPQDFTFQLDPDYYMLSTGTSEKDKENIAELIKLLNPNFVCIDVANGYTKKFTEFVKNFKDKYPDITLIAGNVVTKEMVEDLIINGGVDIVKIGIGSGAMCLTRLKTGVGRPQGSAVYHCSFSAHGIHGHIISDGGIRNPDDACKAYATGADFIMMGSAFAGSKEAGGIRFFNKKLNYGMSSYYAQKKHNGFIRNYSASEGRVAMVDYTGPVKNIIIDYLGSIRSSAAYYGARKIKDIPKCTEYVIVRNKLNDHFSKGR